MTQENIFSEYGRKSFKPSPVNQMMSEFAKDFRPGFDINLGVGYVNEDTIPYEKFAEITAQIVRKENRPSHLLNYGGPEGSARLIKAIQDFYCDLYKEKCIGEMPDFENREIIIGVSGATSILTGIANIINPGIVITVEPIYYIYTSTLERYGFKIETVPEVSEGPDIQTLEMKLETCLRQKLPVSFCYFVTVNNPTCTVISNRRRKEIVECIQNLSKEFNVYIPIIFDLAYEWLVHNPELEKPNSPSIYDELGSVYEIGTLSKVFAPSLRVGFIIGPKGSSLLKAIVQWNSDVGFSAPLITQEISTELIQKYGREQFQKVNEGYREKGTLFKNRLIQEVGKYMKSITGGDAGFYLYITFHRIETTPESDFFNLLSRKSGISDWDWDEKEKKQRVIYLPGIYCNQQTINSKFQLRVSYGYEESSKLIQAVQVISSALSIINSGKH